MVTESKVGTFKPKYRAYQVNSLHHELIHSEPNNVQEALMSKEWKNAMQT